jgi:polyisoprenoid-binding protein YceI
MSSRSLFLLTLCAAMLGAVAMPAMSQTTQATAQLLPAQSEIAFTTRQMGVPVEGKFGKFAATIALDPKKPEGGNVAFKIDTGSARFGSAELDAEVPKPIWLSAAKFPQASFQSTAIKAAGPGRFEVAGKLTIKGQVRDVIVPVQLVQAASASQPSTASGSFTIKRLDFKVGEAEWADTSLLANDVIVRFKLALTGIAPL